MPTDKISNWISGNPTAVAITAAFLAFLLGFFIASPPQEKWNEVTCFENSVLVLMDISREKTLEYPQGRRCIYGNNTSDQHMIDLNSEKKEDDRNYSCSSTQCSKTD